MLSQKMCLKSVWQKKKNVTPVSTSEFHSLITNYKLGNLWLNYVQNYSWSFLFSNWLLHSCSLVSETKCHYPYGCPVLEFSMSFSLTTSTYLVPSASWAGAICSVFFFNSAYLTQSPAQDLVRNCCTVNESPWIPNSPRVTCNPHSAKLARLLQ